MTRMTRLSNRYFAAYWIEAGSSTGAKMVSTARGVRAADVARGLLEDFIYSPERFYKPTRTALVLVRLRDSEVPYFERHLRDGSFLSAGHILVRSVERLHGPDHAVEVSSETFFRTLDEYCLDRAA